MDASIEMRVKKCIIERLNLKVDPEDIDNAAPIFVGAEVDEDDAADEHGLGLDSIDALELVVALGNEFGVQITDDDMTVFESVNSIADFIRQNRPETSEPLPVPVPAPAETLTAGD